MIEKASGRHTILCLLKFAYSICVLNDIMPHGGDNASPKNHRLFIKNPITRYWKLPLSCWAGESKRLQKTIYAIAVALECSLELEGKTHIHQTQDSEELSQN